MLVLSRRLNETIVLPTVGITVHILGVKGNVVKVGIDAPPEVKILREELAQPEAEAGRRPSRTHALRNRLNKVSLSLHLFERQWQAGRLDEAGTTLNKVFELLDGLEWECSGGSGPAPAAAPVQRSALRSLVIEDDTNERELLAGLLRMNGCDCQTAADGLEALDYLAGHERPDVVLLDMFMPRCDGRETLARIRGNPALAGLKVFAISGTPPKELGIATGPGGVDGWFPKPLNPPQLWQAIQNSLASASAAN
jgi:carbon storage regulator CsrA